MQNLLMFFLKIHGKGFSLYLGGSAFHRDGIKYATDFTKVSILGKGKITCEPPRALLLLPTATLNRPSPLINFLFSKLSKQHSLLFKQCMPIKDVKRIAEEVICKVLCMQS